MDIILAQPKVSARRSLRQRGFIMLQFAAVVVALLIVASAMAAACTVVMRTKLAIEQDSYLSVALGHAEGDLAANIAAAVHNNTTPNLSLTLASPCGPSASSCPYSVSASVTAHGSTKTAAPGGNETAHDMQPLVGEQHLDYAIVVTLSNAQNQTVASRSAYLGYRTFTAAPYVTLTSVHVEGSGGLAGTLPGSVAGCNPALQSTCVYGGAPAVAATTPADTTIQVYNMVGGKPVPTASPSQTTTYNDTNGNANGWSH